MNVEKRLIDYQFLFKTADIAMKILDQEGIYLECNRAYLRLFGHEEGTKLLGAHPEDVSPKRQPDGRDSFEKANEMIEIALAQGEHAFEWLHKRVDGEEFLSYVKLDIIDFDDQRCVRAVIHDVTQTRRLEKLVDERTKELSQKNRELNHLYSIDPLTKLYNRRGLDTLLSSSWERSLHSHSPLGILFVDIDYFKNYNDNYGHLSGDKCLLDVANILKESADGESDHIARYGGEEFVVILSNTDHRYVTAVASSIIDKVKVAQIVHEHSPVAPYLTVSIGCAVSTPGKDVDRPERLLQIADEMLYRSKKGGRNRYSI